MDPLAPAASGHVSSPAMGSSPNEGYTSGISWAAVIGGAFVAAGLGGYLAGRLRTKWVNVHTDEVFFRDTAHGFLAWAVALVISASFLASAATSMIGGAVQAGSAGFAASGTATLAATATNARSGQRAPDSNAYFVDTLFRADTPATGGDDSAVRAEVGRIFVKGLGQKEFTMADQNYMAKRVAAATGIPQADAEKRVADIVTQARNAEAAVRQAADGARKTAAHAALWIFLSLLVGAFCASYAATIGGRQRDHVVA